MFSLPINPKIDESFANNILIPFLNNFDTRITSGLLELSGHVNNMSKIYESFIKSKITLHVENLKALNESNETLLATIDKNILDFGCGFGDFLDKIKNAKSYSAVELREQCI